MPAPERKNNLAASGNETNIEPTFGLPHGLVSADSVFAAESNANVEKRARRVLHLINGEYYAGAERVQDLLAANLEEFGYEVGFACVKPDQFDACREFKRAPLHSLKSRSKFDLRPIAELRQIIRAGEYNLLHAHTPRSALFAKIASKLENIPMVYHVHSPAMSDTTRPIVNRIKALIERASLVGVESLIAVSSDLGQYMQTLGYSPDRIKVVPNGVPCIRDLPERQTPTGEWVLGSVALFRPRKGIEILLDAIHQLIQNGYQVRLRAIGGFESDEYEQSVKQKAQDLGIEHAIDWVGFSSDVNAELQKLDLFVLPSLFGEGMPMVILEAMANGVPPISTRIDGLPQVVRDGVDGLLAAPNSSEDLARQISLVIDGEIGWRDLRDNSIERHREHFSDACMARGVADVYDAIWEEHNLPDRFALGQTADPKKVSKNQDKKTGDHPSEPTSEKT